MGVKTAGTGHFQIPTAPAAGTSVTSGAANTYTTTYVQLIASSAAALYITGIYVNSAAVRAWTYCSVQLAIGAAASETVIGQYLISLETQSATTTGYRAIFPPIPVATGIRIAVKTADSVGAIACLVSLECLAQSNYVDDGVAVGTVTTVTNQLTAAAVATGVWQDATAGDFTTASSIGKAMYIANIAPGAAGGHFIAGSNLGTTTFGALTVTGATTHTGNVVFSDGMTISAPSTLNRAGFSIAGNGTGAGLLTTGGATGVGFSVVGGGTSGDGIKSVTTLGHGINLAPVGSSMHGLFATGGSAGTSDGIKATAGTGGVDFRANQTGNLTGTVATLTTYTGNTPQTGDAFTRLGAAGAGLTALGDTRIANLDAAVTTRMATFTQPTGFLAATFPATVASTTNITAGTITTTTNLTNAVTLNAADTPTLATGTSTAGAASAITLQTALGADSLPVGSLIKITSGTGTKQTRAITGYVDSTKVVTVDRAWVTNPDATSVYAIMYNEAAKLDSSLQATAASVQGSVTGAVGSVTGNVGGNVVGSVASVTGAVGSVTGLTASNLDATISSRATPTNITAGTITTVTNLTNAPTAGDLTATMKTSVTTAATAATPTAAAVTGAVGSVTGNVGGNVTGSVGSVTGAVGSVTAAVSLSAAESKSFASGTATAGGATTITLQTALGTDNIAVGSSINITSGTGAKQTRIITGYVDATKVVTVGRAWVTNPDATSVYSIIYDALPKVNSSLEVTAASVSGAVGSVTGAVGSVTGAVGSVTGAVASVTGNVGGNVAGTVGSVVGAVGSVTGLTASDVGAIKTKTDSLTFTVANKVDTNTKSINDVTVAGIGTGGSPWHG